MEERRNLKGKNEGKTYIDKQKNKINGSMSVKKYIWREREREKERALIN